MLSHYYILETQHEKRYSMSTEEGYKIVLKKQKQTDN